MGLRAWLRGGTEKTPPPAPVRLTPAVSARALAGGRVSTDDTSTALYGTPRLMLSPTDAESQWRLADLDSVTLSRVSPTTLLELLADLSPDISRALWDFLRLCNPGWEVAALVPGSEETDDTGQELLDGFLARLRDLYGSVDVVLARLYLGAYLRGAFMAELILDKAGREAVDLATPDPASARFERRTDPERGAVWQLGQWQARTGFVALDRPTVRYVPVDPLPGKPYGRAPAAPALFSTLFLLGLMHDLRRVVAQQGYPRLDIAILTEKLNATLPPSITSDPTAYKTWVEDIISEVQSVYTGLEPDDTYIHTDVVQVNRPVGTVDADSLGAIDGLIEALERQSVRALKTMPLMMGITDGVSEANANRQWEIHAAGIKALQHLCESLLEHLLGLVLQAQGVQATVRFRFAELRAAEAMRDAQTRAIEINNALLTYLYGWETHEAAAQSVTGHEPAAAAPLAIPSSAAPSSTPGTDTVAEPGSNRDPRGRLVAFTPPAQESA